MLINKLKIENFKAFANEQPCIIKPLTLLFGPNSSGKSSIIHSIALLHEINRIGNVDIRQTQIGGASIDLGGFDQFLHKRSREWPRQRVKISLKFDTHNKGDYRSDYQIIQPDISELNISTIEVKFKFGYKLMKGDDIELNEYLATSYVSSDGTLEVNSPASVLQWDIVPQTHSVPMLLSIEVYLNEERLLSIEKDENADNSKSTGKLPYINEKHPIWNPFFNLLYRHRMDEAFQGSSQSNELSSLDLGNILEGISKHNNEESEVFIQPVFDTRNHLVLEKILVEKVGQVTPQFDYHLLRVGLNLISEIVRQNVLKFIGNMQYLGPLRSFPPRVISYHQQDDPNYHSGGAFAWTEILNNESLVEKINGWLGSAKLNTPYKLEIHELVPFERFRDAVSRDGTNNPKAIVDYLNKTMVFGRTKEVILNDGKTGAKVTHRDIGIGVSQVLPVLVRAFGSKKKFLAIEQPEIHLHPALQAELGDLFIESALGENKNTILLETHSEHLILRVLRRIREYFTDKNSSYPITPEDISVLYAIPTEQGTVIKPLPVTDDGDFVDKWPGGFFDEREKELF